MGIIIIDDHILFNESLQSVLQAEFPFSIIRTYSSAEDFLAQDHSAQIPDLIISDIMMKGMGGLEMLVEARKRFGDSVWMIIISSLTDTFTVKDAFAKGADAYLSKDASKAELMKAISLKGSNSEKYTNESMKNKLLQQLFQDDKDVNINLSPRENEVLQKICRGITPKEIAFGMNLSIHTVRRFIKNIMNKFQIHRTAELITFAIEKGLYKREE